MAGFTESSITLDFPTQTWFRLERSEPYSALSGFNFKEMDACWVKRMGSANATFYAVELKDYTQGNLQGTADRRIWDIVKKVVDTMQMFLSALFQNDFGRKLEEIKSVDLHTGIQKAVFVTIVNIDDADAPLFHALKDECLRRLKGYSLVWDKIEIHLMTKSQAQNHFAEFVRKGP